jgi:hypothetical protein
LADFSDCTFANEVDFSNANFLNYVRFAAQAERLSLSQASKVSFQQVRAGTPDHVSFSNLTLHPHWFINVNARRFEFNNVTWTNSGEVKPELELLRQQKIDAPDRLLTIACRKLAANAEENDRYREASHFRRMAMDAERLEKRRGFPFLRLNWWYWLASGYGERPFQAFIVLLGVLLLFGLFFTRVGFSRPEPPGAMPLQAATSQHDATMRLNFSRALTYSAGVMTLQKPEPRPATTAAQSLVLLETIVGPVQAALLALAIRRKFMR